MIHVIEYQWSYRRVPWFISLEYVPYGPSHGVSMVYITGVPWSMSQNTHGLILRVPWFISLEYVPYGPLDGVSMIDITWVPYGPHHRVSTLYITEVSRFISYGFHGLCYSSVMVHIIRYPWLYHRSSIVISQGFHDLCHTSSMVLSQDIKGFPSQGFHGLHHRSVRVHIIGFPWIMLHECNGSYHTLPMVISQGLHGYIIIGVAWLYHRS